MKRRTILTTVGGVTTISIAGCNDSGEDEESESTGEKDNDNRVDDSPESDDSPAENGSNENRSDSVDDDTNESDGNSTDTDKDTDTSNGDNDGGNENGDDDANKDNSTDDESGDESKNGDDNQEPEPEHESEIINSTPIGVTDLSVSGCTVSATAHRGETDAASVRIVFQVTAYDSEEVIYIGNNNIKYLDVREDTQELSHELDNCEGTTRFVLEITRIDEIKEREGDVDGHLSMEDGTDGVLNIVSHEFVTENDSCYVEAVVENEWDEEIEAIIFVEVHWRDGRQEETNETVDIVPGETETVRIDTGNCPIVGSYLIKADVSGRN